MKEAGWITRYDEPGTAPLTPELYEGGAEERAKFILQFDPPASVRELAASPTRNRNGVGVTLAVAGFVMDDAALEARGLSEAGAALNLPGVRGRIQACLAETGEQKSCLRWRSGPS